MGRKLTLAITLGRIANDLEQLVKSTNRIELLNNYHNMRDKFYGIKNTKSMARKKQHLDLILKHFGEDRIPLYALIKDNAICLSNELFPTDNWTNYIVYPIFMGEHLGVLELNGLDIVLVDHEYFQ